MGNQLYSQGEVANEAFLLRSGSVEYWVTDSDSVRMSGTNIIIGSSEILIAMNRKEPVKRHTSLVKNEGAIVSPIPAEKLASFLTNYSIGFSVAHHIAETITKMHPLLSGKMNKLHETERLSRDLAKTYVEIIQFLEQESSQKQFPWLFSLMENGKNSSSYNFGLSLVGKGEEKQIDVTADNLAKYKQVYPRGSIICKEGATADEMYILMEGRIEVRIKNNPIDIIAQKGTVIGEMGLILGMPRTATLRSLDETQVVKINSNDMETIFKNDPNTFFAMISSLAFRELGNCEKIREYAQMVQSMSSGEGANAVAQVTEYAMELFSFLQEIEQLYSENTHLEWLKQIRELASNKATKLLAQASGITGETYVLSEAVDSEIEEQDEEPDTHKDTKVPDIDWF